ncbi:RNA-guided endonuclease IscB [Ligilactobacillus equi]|uniref:Paclitaxel taxanoid biosynthesis susceptibility protein ts1 n=1 Tax=Ligilactobacillus equi DSM 15833 = JCM 10991 TaxID=1423740 RepID=A0A0R1TC33_9LACO|nr:RNA-guided endonuclease IscB [Ligilactobacillus equi]KRL78238.1 paclitaxel taxanoid biosynthesis susceptibility protein ts1 [Ligilactobacillus equi DSM 15833 = JCM 10991]
MQNRVFVINKHGEALMPCKPRTARKLLQSGKAKPIKKEPFTIQLLYGASGYKQPINLGVDSGQRHIGLAVTSQDKVLFQSEVELRQDVKKLLERRKTYRQGRRNRKTRYRPMRFLNRIKSRKNNWLPPSVQSKVNHNINWIKRMLTVLPNPELHIEVGKFDMQKMKDPAIKGEGYQKGDLYGYQTVKQYVLARDQYKCQVCKKKGGKYKGKIVKLKIHHIIYRSQGGTNAPANLITVCADCHTYQNHQPGGILYAWYQKKKKVTKPLKGATFMNILRRRLWNAFPDAKFQYGAQTTLQRANLGLAKSHYNDAVTISGIEHISEKPTSIVMFKQFRKKKRFLHEATARKGCKDKEGHRNKNVTSKRNAKNTKEANGFWLNDYVRIKNSKLKGYISGFTGSSCYIKDCLGNYLTLNTYKQTNLSNVEFINHRNNWCNTSISEQRYVME